MVLPREPLGSAQGGVGARALGGSSVASLAVSPSADGHHWDVPAASLADFPRACRPVREVSVITHWLQPLGACVPAALTRPGGLSGIMNSTGRLAPEGKAGFPAEGPETAPQAHSGPSVKLQRR